MIVAYSRIPPKIYRLRWRFTYSDGKPDVFGVWDERSTHKANKASFQDKKNLSRAIIEGEFLGKNRHIIQFIDIPGHEMRHVRCEAFAPLSTGMPIEGNENKVKVIPRLGSMFFQTDTQKIGVDVNGRTFVENISAVDKFQSFEHSAGV